MFSRTGGGMHKLKPSGVSGNLKQNHSAQSASESRRDIVTVHKKNGGIRSQTPIRL